MVDFKHELTNIERFIIFSEIIMFFDVKESLLDVAFGYEFPFCIETFDFVDINNSDDLKKENTIIKQLFDYNLSVFRFNKKNYRILANVKLSLELIEQNKKSGINYFYLQSVKHLTSLERKYYFKILSIYLRRYTKYNCKINFDNKQVMYISK